MECRNDCPMYPTLEVKITHIEDDIKEMKADRKVMQEAIVSFKETNARIATVLENQEKRMTEQEKRIEEQDAKNEEQYKLINNEISGLRTDLNSRIDDIKDDKTNILWYQRAIETFSSSYFKVTIIIIFALLGVKFLGIDINKILNL